MSDKKFIQSKAQELLNRYHKKSSVSVNPDAIASRLGLKVVYGSFDDESVSAFLGYSEDRKSFFIAVNKNHSPVRQRYSVAHEIGHYILHSDRTPLLSPLRLPAFEEAVFFRGAHSSRGTDKYEIEANRFAAELLMPTDAIAEIGTKIKRRLRKEGNFSMESHAGQFIDEMARAFNVSSLAMTIRLGL